MTELAPNIVSLSPTTLLNTETGNILYHDKDMSWILEEQAFMTQIGLLRKIDRIDQMKDGIQYVLPVYCSKIYKRGKTTYAELMDRNQTFEYPINGKRLIDNKWVDFNFRMYPSSAYLLIAMRNKDWPHELYIVKHKKVEKA